MKNLCKKCLGKSVYDLEIYNHEDMVGGLNDITPVCDTNGICIGLRTFSRNPNDRYFKVYDNFKNKVIEVDDLLIFPTPNLLNSSIHSVCYIKPDIETYLKLRYDYPEMILQSQVEYYTKINPVPYERMKEIDYIPEWLSKRLDKILDGKIKSQIDSFVLQGRLADSKVVWSHREYVFSKFYKNDDDYIKDIIYKKFSNYVTLLNVQTDEELIMELRKYKYPATIIYSIFKDTTIETIKDFIQSLTDIVSMEGPLGLASIEWDDKEHLWRNIKLTTDILK